MSRFHTSLRYKIGAWMLLLSLVPLALVSSIVLASVFVQLGNFSTVLRTVEASLRDDVVGKNLAGAAVEASDVIDDYFLARIKDVRRWSNHPAIVAAAKEGSLVALEKELAGITAAQAQQLLELGRMVPVRQETRAAALTYVTGPEALEEPETPFLEVVITEISGINVVITRAEVERFDHSGQAWWKAARTQGEKGIGLVDAHVDPQEKKPVVGIALPITDPNDKQRIYGVIRALFRLSDVQQRISKHARLAGADIRVFTRDGRVLADTASEHSSQVILAESANVVQNQDLAAGRALASRPSAEGAGHVVVDGPAGRVIHGYAHTQGGSFYEKPAGLPGFQGLGWGLTVSEPEDQALKVLKPFIQAAAEFEGLPALLGGIFAGVSVVFGLLAIGGAVLVSGSITGPVVEVSRMAQRVQEGDLTVRVPVHSADEVGKLSGAFNLMTEGLQERERERDIFGRVVTPEVREKLLAGNLELGGETRSVTVLFSDIRGFSTVSERMTPHELVAFLNEYLTEMTSAIRSQDGYLNNFIGDAVVAIFGAPLDQPDKEKRAVEAAMAMRRRLADLNRRRIERGELPIQSGIGISTGEAVAGQVGSLERLMYTVIGDAVNVAARLETLTKEYPDCPILLNGETVEALDDPSPYGLKPLGQLPVKGRQDTVMVYGIGEPS